MTFLATAIIAWFAVSAGEVTPTVIQAPDSPVRLDHAKILNIVDGEPAVLLYAATNLTDNDLEQFTVIAFIFDGSRPPDAGKAQHEILDDGDRRAAADAE